MTRRFDGSATARDVVAGLDLHGRRAIVTGGAGDMGREIAFALAGAGAAVTVVDLDAGAAQQVAAAIGARAAALDLGALADVARFCASWAGPLDMLVNNAGIMACPQRRSADGHELQFAVNYLGHWALAQGLRPALEAAAQQRGEAARVVSVSSIAHRRAQVDFEDPDFHARPYDKWAAYGQSKTACALLALAITARWQGLGVVCNTLNPGGSLTGLMRHLSPEELRASGFLDAEGRPPARWRSPAQCAATATWAATAPELADIGGRYFEECAEAAPWQPDRPMQGVMAHAQSLPDAERLWALSQRMVA
jgi:NAD(P)-dependent dehydrogenase (short-subunit alcohol dehydrogenase family)